ncbi:DUF6247 family protein [Streptomyces nojiriensis]|uniref:DUF6247 family protein n=1 Tax=Streptomyces nojiriensis TaxID=66374 RepID=UPI0036495D5A
MSCSSVGGACAGAGRAWARSSRSIRPRRSGWLERDYAKALEDARHAFGLTPLHEVVRTWQLRVATAPDVDAFMGSGRDDAGFVDLDDVLGGRP